MLFSFFKTNVVGFCIDEGTRTTHTAIAARSLEIPAVVGAHGLTEQVGTGDVIALDGDAGEVVIRPSDAQREAYVERDERLRAVRDRLDRKRSPITSSVMDSKFRWPPILTCWVNWMQLTREVRKGLVSSEPSICS